MEAYKVIYDQKGKYLSCWISVLQKNFKCPIKPLEYKIGEWTKPNIGKIFCFQTLDDAVEFVKNLYWTQDNKRIKIFLSEVEELEDEKYCLQLSNVDELNLNLFWRAKRSESLYSCFPYHKLVKTIYETKVTDSLKLIKEINWREINEI